MDLKMNKEKIRIPLFWKFTIGMVVVVVLFGSINVALVHRIIFSSLEKELQHRGVFMSQIVSQRAINYILFEDLVALNVLIDEVKAADESIEYILVCDPDCNIMAHTFDKLFPAELAFVHSRQKADEILTGYVQFKGSDKVIRDISIPLLDGNIGYLRVGITEDNITRTLDQATTALLGMILVLVVISLAGTFIFSYLVTSPVKDISMMAESLDLQSIREKRVLSASRYPDRVFMFMDKLPGDEIDILVSKFNEMVHRLQEAYAELELAQKKLIQSEKLASIGTLAAGVAHEVNNPLAGIIYCIGRIKKNPENRDEKEKYLILMEEAAHKVEKVVKSLLDFARQPEKEKSSVSIKEVINTALSLASHRMKQTNIRFEPEESDVDFIVDGNKNQLEQVFLNLFLNSIDAIEEKKIKNISIVGEILIRLIRSPMNNNLYIEITDNGIGIPETNLNKIIDPFFTTKEVGKGTGLGLSVSVNIIKDHGGDIDIKSTPGTGTTVLIQVPLINHPKID
jgi:two-component system, NtrC family, sensor kinase